MIKSKIVCEHNNDCFTLKIKKEEGILPWNVVQMEQIICNSNGELINIEEAGRGELWYSLKCPDQECPAEKRINAKAIAEL